MIDLVPSSVAEAIAFLSENHISFRDDPKKTLIVKLCKNILKDSAKKGELSLEERVKILSVLPDSECRFYNNDPRFRHFIAFPTRILFRSPKLWEILCYPEKHPQDTEHLQSLSDGAFDNLLKLTLSPSFECFSICEGAEILRIVSLLDISELKKDLEKTIHKKISSIENSSAEASLPVGGLHLLATVWPSDKEPLFSKLMKREFGSLGEEISIREIAKEFYDFNVWIKNPETLRWQELSAPMQYRLFIFVHASVKKFPKLSSLRLELLDNLLELLKSGKLDASCADRLIQYARGCSELFKRLKKDEVEIELENIGSIRACIWPLFAKSDYFQALITSPMKQLEKVHLEGNAAKHFLFFYALWMDKKTTTPSSYTIDTLMEILIAASFFLPRDFDELRTEIEEEITIKCQGPYFARIAKVACLYPCPKLESFLIRWLGSYISMQKTVGGQYSVKIEINKDVGFETLQTRMNILKVLKDSKRLTNVVILPTDRPLSELIHLYILDQLDLPKKEFEIEERIPKIWKGERENSKFWDDPSNPWPPFNVLLLFCGLKDESLSLLLHLLEHSFHSSYWRFIDNFAWGQTPESLKKKLADFKRVKLDITGEEMLGLPAAKFLQFLPFFLEGKEELPSKQIASFCSITSKFIREKKLNHGCFVETLQFCKLFYPEKTATIQNLKIAIAYPDGKGSMLKLPIHLLCKINGASYVFNIDGKMGKKFEEIPLKSAGWAADFTNYAIGNNESFFMSNYAANSLTPSHFQALHELQKGQFLNDLQFIKNQVSVLSSAILQFDEETLLAAAMYAASIGSMELISACIKNYCPGELDLPKIEYKTFWLKSLNSGPLKMLRSIGAAIESLEIHVETYVLPMYWDEVCEACPNLKKLKILLKGEGTSIRCMPLKKLSQLKELVIWPKDTACWKSLEQLKIPQSISKVTIEVYMDHIEKMAPYGFFDNLPPKGVTLILHLPTQGSSLWKSISNKLLPSGNQCTDVLFSHLKHCTEFNILMDDTKQ